MKGKRRWRRKRECRQQEVQNRTVSVGSKRWAELVTDDTAERNGRKKKHSETCDFTGRQVAVV
jgi:hypothetical protein